MAATRKDVDRWIKTAKKNRSKYIISVCDTFDYEDYPIYVLSNENLEEKKKQYNDVNMQRINEIITINEDGTVSEPVKTIF